MIPEEIQSSTELTLSTKTQEAGLDSPLFQIRGLSIFKGSDDIAPCPGDGANSQSFGVGVIFLPQWIFSSVQFSHSVVSNSLRPHGLQHARPPRLSPTPGVYSNSCPLSLWCHPTISSTVFPFSSHLQSFPASRSFPMSQFLTSSGLSIGVSASASILPVNIQDGFPFGWAGWISLQSKGFSRVFSNTTVNFTQVLRSDRSLPCWVLFLLPENVPPLYFKILFILY